MNLSSQFNKAGWNSILHIWIIINTTILNNLRSNEVTCTIIRGFERSIGIVINTVRILKQDRDWLVKNP